jgi:hypothetical protein
VTAVGAWGIAVLCRVEKYVVIDEGRFEFGDAEDLGVMPWADLKALVESEGGHRVAYDLAEVRLPDGGVFRYRMTDVGP